MARVKARADAVVGQRPTGVERWLRGMARLHGLPAARRASNRRTTVRVGDDVLTAPRIFINVGGRARVPDLPGVESVPYLTNTSMLELDTVPRHLVVVGGSYIGLEFAQMYRRFGAEVTVIEMAPRLIAREDEDVSDAIRDDPRARGDRGPHRRRVHRARAARRGRGGRRSTARRRARGRRLARAARRRPPAEHRRPRPRTRRRRDRRARLHRRRRQLRTNVPGIWALGDCNGRGAFTHTSYNDFEIVAANLLDGGDARGAATASRPTRSTSIRRSAASGMTEAEARASGRPLLVGEPADDPGRPRGRERRDARAS